MYMKKQLQTILLIFAVLFVPFTMRAQTVAEQLAANISNFTGGGTGELIATASGNTVTVTGSLTGVTHTLYFGIDPGITVVWNANISGIGDENESLINIAGSGTFNVSGGSVVATNDGVFAIKAWDLNATVIVSGGTVSATTGEAITTYDENSSVTVSGGTVSATTGKAIGAVNVTVSGGEVSATSGNTITAWGTNPTVTVSGGTISTTTGIAIIVGENSTVMVNGTGKVEATGDGGIAIQTNGSVEVSGGTVSATTGTAIAASGNVEVSGGIVSATGTNGAAIGAWGTNTTVTVSGGTVSAATGAAIAAGNENSTITVSGTGIVKGGGSYIINAWGENSTITVSDQAKVQATGDGGAAINVSPGTLSSTVTINGGEVSATTGQAILVGSKSSNITVNGGIVSATTGFGINAYGESPIVTVNGGLVFAYGTSINNAITNGFTGAAGTGVVIAWNQAAGTTTYTKGNTDDISKSPASATVQWNQSGTDYGISYINGTNTGFIPLGITVVSPGPPYLLDTPFGDSGSGNGTYYDPTTQTITFLDGMWSNRGWWFGNPDGKDFSAYNEVVVSFKPTNLDITLHIQYSDGLENMAFAGPGATSISALLLEGKKDNIRQIYFSADGQGTLTLISASADNNAVNVTGISLDATASMYVGDTKYLNPTIVPANATDQNVTWSSSNTSVATVEYGNVTAVDKGTATITVTTEDGNKTATCIVTVNSEAPVTIPVAGVSLNTNSLDLKVDSVIQLTATIEPSNASNQNIIWSSSNEAVATVSNTGLVKAIAEGTATITVTTEDGGFKAQCTVTVQKSQTVVVDEGTPAGSNGTGTIEISLQIPSNVPFTGTFKVTLPNGMSIDVNATKLADGLGTNLVLTITQNSDGTWLFTITSTALRSSMNLVYQKIADIVYKVDKSVSDGTYKATVNDLNLNFDDGTSIVESELPVSITVDHSYAGIPSVSAEVKAYVSNNVLYINSPASEIIRLYSVSGSLLYSTKKPAGEVSIPLNGIQDKILIIRSSSGWVKKGIR